MIRRQRRDGTRLTRDGRPLPWPATVACVDCLLFVESPAAGEHDGECRRDPEPRPTNRSHWCGSFRDRVFRGTLEDACDRADRAATEEKTRGRHSNH